MQFEFATAQRIFFGPGERSRLPDLIRSLGNRAALITGSSPERSEQIIQLLKTGETAPVILQVKGEPTTEQIAAMVRDARRQECDFVVAFGGGSVIDAGKAIAALLTNRGDLMDYLEVIGGGEPLTQEPAPCIAIPTTAGTGAEVTRNAVLQSPEHKVKVSMRHPGMLPTVALVDPELTLSMPPEVTASTGLDALIQLLEAFVSIKATPLTDEICRGGLKRVTGSLYRAYVNGGDLEARTDMMYGSLCGGLALANAGLGAVHGFAGPIGGMYSAPHGMVCASLFTAATHTNVEALTQRKPDHPALERYTEAAKILLQNDGATIHQAIDHLNRLCMQMQVPGLRDFGVTESEFPVIIDNAKNASSMKGNPLVLTDAELMTILEHSFAPPNDREGRI